MTGTVFSVTDRLTFLCVLANQPVGSETDADAAARFNADLASGLTFGPLIISEP